MLLHKKISPGWYITFVLFMGLFVLPLTTITTYFDGLHYAIISQNIGNEIGDMWHLYWRQFKPFYEHPPLFFLLEGLLFKIFGKSFISENIFMLLISTATVFMIYKLWILTGKGLKNKHITAQNAWIPLLLWTISSGIAWSYTNNILDTLMGLFSLIAVYYILKKCFFPNQHYEYIYLIIGGGGIFLAYLSKGPIGLYPLAIPFIHTLFFKKEKWLKGIGLSILLSAIVIFCFLILILYNPDAFEFLKIYHNRQVVNPLRGSIDPNLDLSTNKMRTASHLYERPLLFLRIILSQISIPLLLGCIVIYIQSKLRKISINRTFFNPYKTTIRKHNFILILALTASAPIMLTQYILPWYFTTCAPLYGLWLGGIFVPFYQSFIIAPSIARKLTSVLQKISLLCVLIFILIGIKIWGKTTRRQEIFHLCTTLNTYCPPHADIFSDPNIEKDPDSITNMYIERYCNMYLHYLTKNNTITPTYLLLEKKEIPNYQEALRIYDSITVSGPYQLYKYRGPKE